MKIFKRLLNKYFTVVFLSIIFLASTWSLFRPGFFHVHDWTQGARIAEMGRSLAEGQFPVRWSENFGYGFGMPLFNFYAPLPYYLAGLLFNWGLDLITCLKLLYFIPSLLVVLGAFKLGKKLGGNLAGIILAAAYTLAPYRAVNFFVRGAVSEAWAMAFLPWVLSSIIDLAQNLKSKQNVKKNYLVLLLSLLAIILSHNLTALMFIPLSGILALLIFWKKQNCSLKKTWQAIWPVFLIYLLAFSLSAFYSLPAVMEKDATQINLIFSGYFHYSYHFLYIRQFFKPNFKYGGSVWGPEDDMSFFLGWGQILGLFVLALLLVIFIIKQIKNRNLKKIWQKDNFFYVFIFGASSLLALLMSLMKSKFLWDKLSILQYIQFPWRYLTVATLTIAVLLALSLNFFKKTFWRYLYSYLLFITLLVNLIYFKPEVYLDNPEALYYSDEAKIQNEMSGILPDYIPTQMAPEEMLAAKNLQLSSLWPEENNWAKINSWQLLVDRGHEKLFELDLKEETLVNFKIAYFPGWIAQIDNENTPVSFEQSLGNLQVLVPEGKHQLSLQLSEKTPSRLLGNSISVISLIIAAAYFSPFLKKRDKNSSTLKD